MYSTIAVIDTETNWDDEVMSIGVVIADKETLKKIDERYYVIEPEYRRGGMFSDVLFTSLHPCPVKSRKQCLNDLHGWLKGCNVEMLFAYNARFDYSHLPELSCYRWFDIMKLAANRNFNPFIPDHLPTYKTGRLKKGYGVEAVLNMLVKEQYNEIHNALQDARDELKIMQILAHHPDVYEPGRI